MIPNFPKLQDFLYSDAKLFLLMQHKPLPPSPWSHNISSQSVLLFRSLHQMQKWKMSYFQNTLSRRIELNMRSNSNVTYVDQAACYLWYNNITIFTSYAHFSNLPVSHNNTLDFNISFRQWLPCNCLCKLIRYIAICVRAETFTAWNFTRHP